MHSDTTSPATTRRGTLPASDQEPPWVWDRAAQRLFQEPYFTQGVFRWLYGTRLGGLAEQLVFSRRPFHKLYGRYQKASLTRAKIAGFCQEHGVDIDDYAAGDWPHFAAFFTRRFKPGLRPFTPDGRRLAAFAEARYLGWQECPARVPAKGVAIDLEALVQDAALARAFAGGPVLLARLAPADYHWFHYPDDGRLVQSYRISGLLHSVNPRALLVRPSLLVNERQVHVLDCAHLGRALFVEIGALCVGRICQLPRDGAAFRRGEAKGYFAMGASTIVMVGSPGAWSVDADIAERTAAGIETLVRLGSAVARKSSRGAS